MQAARTIRLGLIGTGTWGLKYLPAGEEAASVLITHVASPHVADKSLPDAISCHADWCDLLEADLDGVIIATPPETHSEITRAALEAGLAVLVEKPVTLNSQDAQHLLDLAEIKSGIMHVGHIDLQSPALMAIRAQLPQRSDIRKISGNWSNAGPWRDDATPLWDWGPHPLACCLSLTGAPSGPWQAGYETIGEGRLYTVQGNFNGVDVDLHFGNGDTRRQRSLEVVTDAHVYRYDDDVDQKATIDGEPVDYAKTLPLTVQVERLAAAIRQGGADYADAELALQVIRLLEEIEEKTA
jgi:predicted dehydrogenase